MSVQDLTATLTALADARARYSKREHDLRYTLPFTGTTDQADTLLGHAEEFGVAHTTAILQNHPERFNLTATQAAAVTPIVSDLHTLSQDIDGLVAQRENTLTAADPTHQRRYPFWQREFALDHQTTQMVFTDTNERHPIDPQLLEPALEPGPDRQGPERKTRKRRRDREK
jgi:hypothetical protein